MVFRTLITVQRILSIEQHSGQWESKRKVTPWRRPKRTKPMNKSRWKNMFIIIRVPHWQCSIFIDYITIRISHGISHLSMSSAKAPHSMGKTDFIATENVLIFSRSLFLSLHFSRKIPLHCVNTCDFIPLCAMISNVVVAVLGSAFGWAFIFPDGLKCSTYSIFKMSVTWNSQYVFSINSAKVAPKFCLKSRRKMYKTCSPSEIAHF